MPPRTFPCGSSLTRLRLLRRCLTTRRWAAISPAPVPRQLRSKHSPLLRSRPTAKMGPPGRPVNWRRPFRSRLATNFNVPLGRPTGRPRSTTGARQRWQRLRRVRPLVRRGAMHVRALAGGVAPFARPPTALHPSAHAAFPHLQTYFFFEQPRRRCPALGSRCDNDASAKEPVRAP